MAKTGNLFFPYLFFRNEILFHMKKLILISGLLFSTLTVGLPSIAKADAKCTVECYCKTPNKGLSYFGKVLLMYPGPYTQSDKNDLLSTAKLDASARCRTGCTGGYFKGGSLGKASCELISEFN